MVSSTAVFLQRTTFLRLFAFLGLGLLGISACYSALEPAAGSSSQYADKPNTPAGATSAPMPAQAWVGLNLVAHDANTLCVDGVAASGPGVSLQTCSGAVLQRFKWYEGMLSVAGDRCLDLDTTQGAVKAGTAVVLAACDANSNNQLWMYGNGWIYPEITGRTNPASLCLSTGGSDASAGDTLQLAACSQTPSHNLWDMSLYDGNDWVGFPISSAVDPNYCLDDGGNLTADGTRVITYMCHGGPPQRVTVRGGALTINDTCIDIAGDAAADHALIEMHSCVPGAENSLFAIERGRIYPYSGPDVARCIEIPGGNPAANVQLDILNCLGGSSLTEAPYMHWVLGYDVR